MMGKNIQSKWYHNIPSIDEAKKKAEEYLNLELEWKVIDIDGYHFEANLEDVRICIFDGINPVTLVITNYTKEKIDG